MFSTTMNNDSGVAQKSLRIQLPSSVEAPSTVAAQRASTSTTPVRTKPKSILKSRQEETPVLATEPDPLQSETYFMGPFRTLIASVDNEALGSISPHDLTEAYTLLACRIEAQVANLGDDTLLAVAAVQVLPSHVICAAVRRDVACAILGMPDPDSTSTGQRRLTDEERSGVKDRSSLCHAALRFLAVFFRFPSLHRLLKLHELAWLMKEALDVGLSYDLATLNPQKTYSHVIGVLSSQHLSDSVLRPFRPRIAAFLERAASGKLEGSATSGPHIESLKAIYALLHRHGSLLLPEFQTVFKVVLQNLVCPILAFRDLAAKALTAFSHVVLRSHIAIGDQLKLSCIVGAFIDKEVQRAKNMHRHDAHPFVLRDFLKLSENDPRVVQRVTQLLNIVSALLVLSGPCVFIRANSLRFLVKAVGKTQAFRQRELNVLRAATWSCLVRAYALLPSWEIPKCAGLEESAFRVVRQEYREDVGVSVIAVLLGTSQRGVRSMDRVREAVTYLYNLGQMPETRCISAALLRRLLGRVMNGIDSEACTWTDPASVIPEWLSNGSTLEMEPRRLKKVLAPLCGTGIRAVRILEADELVSTWNSLLEVFQTCAIGQLFDKKMENTLQNDTLLLWQTLLKVQSVVSPDSSRTVIRKHILESLATALCAFLDAPHARYPIRPAQALTATHQLWKLVDDELGQVWAAALASSIYRRLLKTWQHEVASNSMGDEWVQLSRSLISSAPKRTLEILVEVQDASVQRVIWLDMVRHIRFKEQPSKEIMSYLLLFPIKASELTLKDEAEFSYWDMLFMLALMHDEPEVVCAKVSEELQRALSVKSCSELRRFFMASVSHVSRSDSSPSLALLSAVADYLEEAYPPENCEDNELVELIPVLQRIIAAYPNLSVVKALSHGLIPWFEDRKTFISDIVYNNDILPLYCDLFSAVRHMCPVQEAVEELAELLAAPFFRERIAEPAVGPVAFKEFWDSVGPILDFEPKTFPSILMDCVISLHSAFGGYVPEWMESQLESQEMMHSSDVDLVVPASVDDLESSDFSPVSVKKLTENNDGLSTRKTHGDTDFPGNGTPGVSPSVDEPSAQFARQRWDEASSPLSLDLERASKKRKLQLAPIKLTVERSSDDPSCELDQLSPAASRRQRQGSSDDAPRSAEEDYSSWEIQVASQDVRDVIQDDDGKQDDDDKTPHPLDSPPEIRDGIREGLLHMRNKLPEHSRMRTEHRSQTAPASLQTSLEDRRAAEEAEKTASDDRNCGTAHLRREHTTTEVPLDALEKLHARLSAEADDMRTQDLAHATKLTYDVLGILNGRMSKKLEHRR